MYDTRKPWLVEIRVYDHLQRDPAKRFVGLEEVLAYDEDDAMTVGKDQYRRKLKYSPVHKRKAQEMGIRDAFSVYASEAIELEF